MFRPPFEIISRLSFEEARDEGKEEEKWLLVNVQDASIFDCQVLNRDIWKNKEIMATIKENFIFLQYAANDPKGMGYIQYYFQSRSLENAYPHIAIVDPRTGEQVKVWSGPPVPGATEFLMQLYEFLDRYSLKADARNPVAKRKPTSKQVPVEAMTEEQMLEMAMKNSLENDTSQGRPAHEDPDELTKSMNLGKGKGRAADDSNSSNPSQSSTIAAESPFSHIPSNMPHAEPAPDAATTTRIQFRYSGGRLVRRFALADPVQRIYEWLKAEPLEGKEGVEFELMFMGRNLLGVLDQTIADAGLRNGSIMVEFAGGEGE
jgi:UBX domain-containing protein 7